MFRKCCAIITVFLLLLTGCNGASDILDTSSSTTRSTPAAPTQRSASITEINTSIISGDIRNIYYGNNNQVLILANKLYLYDLYTGEVLAETDIAAFDEIDCHMLDNRIAVVGVIMGSSSDIICTFYDGGLNQSEEISIAGLLDTEELLWSTKQVAISPDGEHVALTTSSGLFLHKTKTKQGTLLIDLLSEDEAHRFGLCEFQEISFVQDGTTIAFKSMSFDVPLVVGQNGFDTYGTINIDGSGLSVHRSTEYSVKEMIAYDSLVIFPEDFTVSSGRVMVYDLATNTTRVFTTETEKESGNVFGSDTGQSFATSNLIQGSVTVRIYDTGDGSLLLEETISESNDYTAREPQILIWDELKICIVLLGNRQTNLATKYLIFNF